MSPRPGEVWLAAVLSAFKGGHPPMLEMRKRVAENDSRPTPVIDRFRFKSVYFLEPGGVLFELATDGPRIRPLMKTVRILAKRSCCRRG